MNVNFEYYKIFYLYIPVFRIYILLSRNERGLQFNTLIFFYVISVACLDRFFELSCHGERHIVNLQF